MIGFVKGNVDAIYDDHILLDCNDIGYNIFVPGSVISNIHTDDTIKIYTYLSVREDAMNLFGFLNMDDLDLFKKLITVNGIGPKAGLSILSVMNAPELRMAIISGDDKMISKAPGVGNKTAQKVILELKDKINIEDISYFEGKQTNSLESNGNYSEAVMALVSLGYSESESVKAVKCCDENCESVEDIIKDALKRMM
jgi:holliday junction DNA helicase RuvA